MFFSVGITEVDAELAHVVLTLIFGDSVVYTVLTELVDCECVFNWVRRVHFDCLSETIDVQIEVIHKSIGTGGPAVENSTLMNRATSTSAADLFAQTDLHAINPYAQIPADLDNDWMPERQSTRKRILRLALTKYLSLLLSSPFEVAQILLQIQYMSNRLEQADVEVDECAGLVDAQEDEASEPEPFDEDEDVFQRRYDEMNFRVSPNRPAPLKALPTDASGYIASNAIRPLYELSPPLCGGLWDTIKRVLRHRPEGVAALFKGLNVHFGQEMINSLCRPAVEDFLNDTFNLYISTLVPLIHQENYLPNLCTIVVSHMLVDGLLTSPLDIVRTRMIAQSSYPAHRKFSSSLACLWDLSSDSHVPNNDERTSLFSRIGCAVGNMYPHIRFSMFYYAMVPVLEQTPALIIHRYFKLSLSSSPLKYGVAQFLFSAVELLIRLPLETIRRRMHLQAAVPISSGTRVLWHDATIPATKFKTCVRVTDQVYLSHLDCIQRIIRDEELVTFESRPQKKYRRKRGPKSNFGGVCLLYRGFLSQLGTSMAVSVLSIISGLEIVDDSDFHYF